MVLDLISHNFLGTQYLLGRGSLFSACGGHVSLLLPTSTLLPMITISKFPFGDPLQPHSQSMKKLILSLDLGVELKTKIKSIRASHLLSH